MTKHDDGGYAFPAISMGQDMQGMSLLDWFAATCEEPFSDETSAAWAAESVGIAAEDVPTRDADPEVRARFWAAAIARGRYVKAAAMIAEKRRREQQEQDDDEA